MNQFLVITIVASFSVINVLGENSENANSRSGVTPLGKRGIYFNVGIPVPSVKIPDASYSLTHTFNYWPYKKFYTVNLSTVIGTFYKMFQYLCELSSLGLRLAFQAFDILQMKKSFDTLSQAGGHVADEVDDWKKFGRFLLTN